MAASSSGLKTDVAGLSSCSSHVLQHRRGEGQQGRRYQPTLIQGQGLSPASVRQRPAAQKAVPHVRTGRAQVAAPGSRRSRAAGSHRAGRGTGSKGLGVFAPLPLLLLLQHRLGPQRAQPLHNLGSEPLLEFYLLGSEAMNSISMK